jgi:hypothetical protein
VSGRNQQGGQGVQSSFRRLQQRRSSYNDSSRMQDRNRSSEQQQGGGGQQDLAKRRQQLERRSSDRETRRPIQEQDGGQGRGGSQQRTNNRRPSGGQERRGTATWEQQLRGGGSAQQRASGGHGHSPGLQQADTRGQQNSKERGVGEGQVRRRQNSSTLDSSGGFKDRDSFSWDPNSVTNKKYDKNKYMVSHATKDFTFTYHAGLRIRPDPHPPSENLLRPYLWI